MWKILRNNILDFFEVAAQVFYNAEGTTFLEQWWKVGVMLVLIRMIYSTVMDMWHNR